MSFYVAPTKVGQVEYNQFVQMVQREAQAWGAQTRVDLRRDITGALQAIFEVYWDGRWWELGTEAPFTPPELRNAGISEHGWLTLQSEMAKSLATS